MTGFFYMHFGEEVPESIEKEYNRLLLHEQYLDKKEQKYRVQTVEFDDILTVFPDPNTIPISEYEKEQKRIHDYRIEYLPIALGLLRVEYPDLYCLIIDYYYAEKRVSMADLGERHGMSADKVRYRIKSAKEKLKAYIIMHENGK